MDDFTLTIETGNDALSEDAGDEIARILRDVANKLENGYTSGQLVDYNGNRVGWWSL